MFTCGLVTTLSIVIRCNTTIRSEFIYCTLVAYGVKYVHLFVTTLGIAIRYNATIRLESVRCANDLWTSVCLLLSNNPGIAVRCDTAIRLNSVCCVLVF